MNKSTYEQKIIYKIGSKTRKNGNNNHGSNVRLTEVKHLAPPGINKERKMDAVIMDASNDARVHSRVWRNWQLGARTLAVRDRVSATRRTNKEYRLRM